MNRLEYLTETSSRELLGTYLEELGGQQVPQYDEYLRLAEETRLPLAAGSLVMHHGSPNPIFSPMIQVESKASGTSFHADINTMLLETLGLDSQHRPLRVGPMSRSYILFHHGQMPSAVASQQIWLGNWNLSSKTYALDVPEARRAHDALDPTERLAKFVDISKSLVGQLLEATG